LVAEFLAKGGEIERAPASKKHGPGRPRIFSGEGTIKSASYERGVKKFFAGDDFVHRERDKKTGKIVNTGPQFTSRPVRENSSAKRDTERKAGVAHENFAGAVVAVGYKLRSRTSLHAVDKADVDLVSNRALAASAKRDGSRRSRQVVKIIEDAADDVLDAERCATVSDDLNLNNVEHEHFEKFNLAA
jgi:hypothetical protein